MLFPFRHLTILALKTLYKRVKEGNGILDGLGLPARQVPRETKCYVFSPHFFKCLYAGILRGN